jgi:RNA polymerase sigma-70 factor, ECF subfamily
MGSGGELGEASVDAVVYCVVPRDLAGKLHDLLRSHFAGDATVEVVVERRADDRRLAGERRAMEASAADAERRRIRHSPGRRVADRRVPEMAVEGRSLPRRARAYAPALQWVERVEPPTQQLEDVDSAHLVIALQAGDPEAFGVLYLRYFDRVYGYANIALRDPHEAEDLTQQVFAKAFVALPRFELRRTPFRAWLFRIARNTLLDQMKSLGRLAVTDPVALAQGSDWAVEDTPSLGALDWITDRELLMFVERLPLAQRQVLVLKYMLGLSTSEIAAVLDRKEPDVRRLLHRALVFLRSRLSAVNRTPDRRGHRGGIRMHRRLAPSLVLRERRFAIHR